MKRVFSVLVSIVLLSALFLLGFSWRDLQSGKAPSASSLSRLARVVLAPKKVTDTELYVLSFQRIRNDYYKKVEYKTLQNASFEGLTASLGDPHTAFLGPQIATEFNNETEGKFVGVGARLSADPLGAKVANVFETGPAFHAGVKNNDIITAVDGVNVAGKAIDAIVKRIRGVAGTTVKLTVIREKAPKAITLSMKRAEITTPTVEAKVIPTTQFGYLSVSNFASVTPDQFDAGLDQLDRAKIKGLVIDLRSDPGGLLNVAQDLLSRFAGDKIVVTMKGRNGKKEQVKTNPGCERSFNYPIVVLINEDSASAAEIMAGALRDYRLVTLVGEHSYGKASVQSPFQLKDGGLLKVTIARYYLPSGQDIGRRVDDDGQYLSGGIDPDVPCELNYDLIPTFGDIKTDSQLMKAVEVLNSKQDR
jgi:carboxyl-terminal processing protease